VHKNKPMASFFLVFLVACAHNAEMATSSPTSCTYTNRPSAFPSIYDFTALPSGFNHSSSTDRIVTSSGTGVLSSVGSEKFDIMYSSSTLASASAKSQIDFAFTGSADVNNNVTLYLGYTFGVNTYYQAQISKAGALSIVKLVNGSIAMQTNKIIASPSSGTLVISTCGNNISTNVGSDSVSISDSSPLAAAGIAWMIYQNTGGTAGAVAVDNFGVLVP
jgi:hypothetical protein